MTDVNYLAVLLGSVASFAFGALWYSPALFLPRWMRETGVAPDMPKGNPGKVFGGSFVLTLVSAFVLAYFLGPAPSLATAIGGGALAGLLVGASMGINYLFSGRSTVLWFIDAGFHVFRLAVVGVVLGLWH